MQGSSRLLINAQEQPLSRRLWPLPFSIESTTCNFVACCRRRPWTVDILQIERSHDHLKDDS